MVDLLAERVAQARRRTFIGRSEELALFSATVTARDLPFSVVHVIGAGGIGKTMLLREIAWRCRQQQIAAWYLDARDIAPTSEQFLAALHETLGGANNQAVPVQLANATTRQILLIDNYETLTALDHWLREEVFSQLSAQVLVVLAGRHTPSLSWRTDPGWQQVIRTLVLRNFAPAESRDYLMQAGVPIAQHAAILRFTHGHPLALALVADLVVQQGLTWFQPDNAPDVVQTLLEQFLQTMPTPAQRTALDLCAMLHYTSETMLSELLELPESSDIFAWLRGLSFITAGRGGLFPEHLAREVLLADLRWRNPHWYRELRRRIRRQYLRQIKTAAPDEQQRILGDYIFLHRASPVLHGLYDWNAQNGDVVSATARRHHWPTLLASIERHEGRAAAALAARWFAQQPQGVIVLTARDQSRGEGLPVGFLQVIRLHEASADLLAADPATARAWRYLEECAPLRSGEAALYFRFWMALDSYQDVSAVQSQLFISIVWHYLYTPGLAFSFFPCARPDFWQPLCSYADLSRIPALDFDLDGQRFGVFGHDWRQVPPLAWLDVLATREDDSTMIPVETPISHPLIVLSQPAFGEAVRAALRAIRLPDVLRLNPLLRSRLVAEQAGSGASEAERVSHLQRLLEGALAQLEQSPRDAKVAAALRYLQRHPQLSQEQAAEALNLPFSTFRRHLRVSTERITALLWQWELNGGEPEASLIRAADSSER